MRTNYSTAGLFSIFLCTLACTDAGQRGPSLEGGGGGGTAGTPVTEPTAGSAPGGDRATGGANNVAGGSDSTGGHVPLATGGLNGVGGSTSGGTSTPTDPTSTSDAATPDDASRPHDLDAPAPTDVAFVWGVGIGVTDLDGAVDFFTDVLKLDVEKRNVQREDRVETVLFPGSADRGSRLILMKFNDGRNTRKVTTKLVWQAPNPGAINRAASSHPDYESRLGFGIYQFDGPDTYIQEVGSIFDRGGSNISVPYLIAMGFSVSDLDGSIEFYEAAFGMESSSIGGFSVTDATGTGRIEEYSLVYPSGGGSGLVLQDWSPERNSKDNPVKVVLRVQNAQDAADAVVAAGGSIAKPAARSAAYDNRLLVVAKDPDGYLLELVQ